MAAAKGKGAAKRKPAKKKVADSVVALGILEGGWECVPRVHCRSQLSDVVTGAAAVPTPGRRVKKSGEAPSDTLTAGTFVSGREDETKAATVASINRVRHAPHFMDTTASRGVENKLENLGHQRATVIPPLDSRRVIGAGSDKIPVTSGIFASQADAPAHITTALTPRTRAPVAKPVRSRNPVTWEGFSE
ncbi:hypothetical protein KIPB_003483 [Kipferlia bialata]|uniref:Uncharacterized protein n=1 Tax=Kipferlia bialata TaxID=797122 RepID=A0A9K3GGP5_9EUKA|nr:hypothetical protein KIPB_003483 [Kipferlia bialata]|eukprot:g3483.t1